VYILSSALAHVHDDLLASPLRCDDYAGNRLVLHVHVASEGPMSREVIFSFQVSLSSIRRPSVKNPANFVP
jgi:hypothetical protein